MAKANYGVIDGKTRKIKKQYCVVGGQTKKIKKVYDVVDGKTRLCWSGGGYAWAVRNGGTQYFLRKGNSVSDATVYEETETFTRLNFSGNTLAQRLICQWNNKYWRINKTSVEYSTDMNTWTAIIPDSSYVMALLFPGTDYLCVMMGYSGSSTYYPAAITKSNTVYRCSNGFSSPRIVVDGNNLQLINSGSTWYQWYMPNGNGTSATNKGSASSDEIHIPGELGTMNFYASYSSSVFGRFNGSAKNYISNDNKKNINKIVYWNGKYIGYASNTYYTSTNGTSWSSGATFDSTVGNAMYSYRYIPFTVIDGKLCFTPSGTRYYSNDGITWTADGSFDVQNLLQY